MSVENIFNSYYENLNSVKSYFEKFQSIASAEDKIIQQERLSRFKDLIKDILPEDLEKKNISAESKDEKSAVTEISDQEKVMVNEIVDDIIRHVNYELNHKLKISPKNYEILSRSSFIMLNNYFEFLLSDLLNYYYTKFKDSLKDKEFKLTLKELSEYDNLEDAVKSLVNREVEAIIAENTFSKLLEHFEKKIIN